MQQLTYLNGMKVVLTRDVKDTGRAHETVEVADGHALNFLIPKGMAIAATASAKKNAELRLKAVADRRAVGVATIESRLAALAEEKVTIQKKANEQGHLYDAVGAAEIAAAANVPEEAIRLEKAIKDVGTHDVPVAFGDSLGKFTIEVVAE